MTVCIGTHTDTFSYSNTGSDTGGVLSTRKTMGYTLKPQPILIPRRHVGDITFLLQQWRDGDGGAEQELFALVTPNLRRLAHYLMKGERKGHTLQPPNWSTRSTSNWSASKIATGRTGATSSL